MSLENLVANISTDALAFGSLPRHSHYEKHTGRGEATDLALDDISARYPRPEGTMENVGPFPKPV